MKAEELSALAYEVQSGMTWTEIILELYGIPETKYLREIGLSAAEYHSVIGQAAMLKCFTASLHFDSRFLEGN